MAASLPLPGIVDRTLKMKLWVDPTDIPPAFFKAIQSSYPLVGNKWHEDFSFRDVEILHATLLLAPFRESPQNRDTYLYLASMAVHTVCLDSGDYIALVPNVKGDAARKFSEAFGAGAACLFVTKALAVDWVSIEQIVAGPQGSPDFRASGGLGRIVFEAKGRTNTTKLSEAIAKGVEQKSSYQGVVEGKLVIGSLFRTSLARDQSTMKIVDPPGDFDLDSLFADDAKLRYERLHFLRAVEFAMGRSRADWLKTHEGRWYSRLPETPWGAKTRELGPEFVGSEIDLASEMRRMHVRVDPRFAGFRLFRGIDANLLAQGERAYKEGLSPYKDWQPQLLDAPTRPGRAVSSFSDGTIVILRAPEDRPEVESRGPTEKVPQRPVETAALKAPHHGGGIRPV